MKISIITVVYNGASTIRDCIDSVLSQTYSDIEYLVIDGGSTDGTQAIVKEFDSKIALFLSEKDKGIYDAMNKGIARATGDIIGILNADDLYANSDVVANVVAKFKTSEADAVYADLVFVAPNDLSKITRKWKANAYKRASFLWGWMPPHPTFFVKKEYYHKFGNFRLDLGSAADYELMLRFCYKYQIKLGYLSQTIILMRTGGVSTHSLANRIKANTNDRLAWKVNNLNPYFFTTFFKPLRKITQFF